METSCSTLLSKASNRFFWEVEKAGRGLVGSLSSDELCPGVVEGEPVQGEAVHQAALDLQVVNKEYEQ